MKYLINDQIVDYDAASVHVRDLSLLRGYGIFDFFRLVGLQPLFMKDHLERFFGSADQLRLKCPVGRKALRKFIYEIINLNGIQNSGIRLLLTGGESDSGYSIGEPTLVVMNEPINPLPETQFTDGIKLITHEYLRDLPEIKTTQYLMGIYKQPVLKKAGAADLLYHWNGSVSELTRSNFFIITDQNTIVTPDKDVLPGVNRKHVLNMARDHYNIEERHLQLDEVFAAKEAFITGTTKKVMPVVQVDDQLIGQGMPGPVTKDLQVRYESYMSDYLKSESGDTN